MLDSLDCYELCVQSPRDVCRFLRVVHGNVPRVLREDFCGTAALSRSWVEGDGAPRAVAVDLDAEVVASAAARAERELQADERARLRLLVADCVDGEMPAGDVAADVVFVGNFSIGYVHTRRDLVGYLRRTRERMASGGVFVCDTYGGASAFRRGGVVRKHPGAEGTTVHYSWVHEDADCLTGMVTNSISFRVEQCGEVVQEWPRAFVYRWRLWSIAEVREAMLESGFARSAVFAGTGPDEVLEGHTLGDDWTVLVAGFTR